MNNDGCKGVDGDFKGVSVAGIIRFMSIFRRNSFRNELKRSTTHTGPRRVDCTAQQLRSRIKSTTSIANNPLTLKPVLFRRALRCLDMQRNFAEMVATRSQLIAMMALKHGVGFAR
jgi:hypothetical protein